MCRLKQPPSSDAWDRHSHFEQIDFVFKIKLLHFFHSLNKRSEVQIVVVNEKILESWHSLLQPDVLKFLIPCLPNFSHSVFIIIIVCDFQHILLLQFRVEGVIRRQLGKVQLGDMIKPFIGEVGFGILDFVGFEEGRIGNSTSQVVADVQKLESTCPNLGVSRPLLDDTDIAGVLILSLRWINVSSQPWNKVRLDQVEVILGTVEPEHGNLSTVMIERTQKTGQFVTCTFPTRD